MAYEINPVIKSYWKTAGEFELLVQFFCWTLFAHLITSKLCSCFHELHLAADWNVGCQAVIKSLAVCFILSWWLNGLTQLQYKMCWSCVCNQPWLASVPVRLVSPAKADRQMQMRPPLPLQFRGRTAGHQGGWTSQATRKSPDGPPKFSGLTNQDSMSIISKIAVFGLCECRRHIQLGPMIPNL